MTLIHVTIPPGQSVALPPGASRQRTFTGTRCQFSLTDEMAGTGRLLVCAAVAAVVTCAADQGKSTSPPDCQTTSPLLTPAAQPPFIGRHDTAQFRTFRDQLARSAGRPSRQRIGTAIHV